MKVEDMSVNNASKIIDNKKVVFLDELKKILPSATTLDIQTGYFFFSGFSALADDLKDIKMRIIVGMEVDPKVVKLKKITEDYDLSRVQGEENVTSNAKITNYRESFLALVNNTDLLDEDRLSSALDIFFKKILDGTLEIKMNTKLDHSKYYILHNKPGSKVKGVRFMGSPNFTLSGLKTQLETVEMSDDTELVSEYSSKFESSWSDEKSTTVLDRHLAKEFIQKVEENSALFTDPTPYHVYVRILKELFDNTSISSIKTPSQATDGKYNDFEYQTDAIKQGLAVLDTYGGALIADVVGLGKSIIASGIAANLGLKTIVIAPPHLVKQWGEYAFEFGFNARIYSSGRIDAAIKENSDEKKRLIIVDEAHRYRNEDTNDYQKLHKICLNNKVLLLTATPFNNDPKDIFALIKLFDAPSQSRISTVENLSIEFREQISKYKKLRKDHKKLEEAEIQKRTNEIAVKMRQMIEPVLIRRSRIDLRAIERYNTDLQSQGFEISDVAPPVLLEFDLGSLSQLYFDTLEKITEAEAGYTAARYQPAKYIADANGFSELMKDYYNDVDDFTQAQVNIAKFMRRFLVMRFESSIAAFKSTLDNFIANHELIVAWWDKFGYIPVYKKGNIPDPQNLELVASDEELNDELSENELKRILASPKLTKDVKRGLILIPKGLMKQEFITKVKSDIVLLKKFKADWFKDNVIREDPKLDNVTSNLARQIKEDKNRKIVIFTAYTDTADYVYKHLIEKGLRVFEYTGASASTANKEVVMSNFDAGLEISRQNNDYDILVATDAISEGYNLHRAGIIYNYDIPYNPVRVVQRVGRINRINKKVFDKLYIYNSFPTAIGESEVQTKRISTLKVHLMNTLYGSDTKVLTEAEKLESYFIDNYNEEVIREESESWDAKYRNIWDKLKYDKTLVAEVTNIKQRSFLARKKDNKGMLLFGQKGKGASIFATNVGRENMTRVSAEEVLVYYEATKDEKSVSKTADFRAQFDIGKSKLFKKDQLPDNKGRRGDAITVLNLMIQDTNDTKIIAHAKDARRVITDLDGFPEGTLKRIIDISKSYLKDGDYEGAFKELVSIAPEDYIEGINLRALNFEKEPEALLIAEELL